MTLKTDVDKFQKDINNCLETTEYLYQFCDQIQESSEDELSYFFLQLQGLCQELDRQLSEASEYST